MKPFTVLDPQTYAQQRHLALNRRQFLRGLRACIALPVFESSLRPMVRAPAASKVPLRTAFVYFPNGAHQANWWPTGQGGAFELGRTMQPLAGLKNSIQVLGGLDHKNATAGNDGGGDHARANATFLTGMRARKTDSTDIRVGVSIDQVAAQHVGHLTRFSSLELSCDAVRKSGSCDTGYSCAYQYNISWRSPTTPMTPESNPRLVFERLFGSGAPDERQRNFERRQATQKSLLDFVLEDTRSVARRLGARDRDKLDEYLTSVRAIEQRIERAGSFGVLPEPGMESPGGVPANFGEHMDLMYDLLAVAFQTDSTRIATLLLAGDGANRAFPEIGIPEGHHYCSHHRNQPELMGKVAQIDLYYMRHFAKFLEKLRVMKDVDGNSILHNSMIVYGCGNSDGNRHTHDNLPVILAGGGGGSFSSGRYTSFSGKPMSNLLLTMAERAGVTGLERFGDSTGRLAGL